MIPVLKVIAPGFYSTIQDQGRRGFQHVGVPVSGALDRNGYLLANALVGNPPGAACLEIIGSGPELEVMGTSVRIALVGSGGGLEIGGRDGPLVPSKQTARLTKGETVRVRLGGDAFCSYLAIESGFDVAYAYKPLHHHSVAHAFTNAILYLDYDRRGWDHPTIAFPINCYGRKVISARGFLTNVNDKLDFDPPSPSPARCMDMGAAAARVLRDSPWRVALMASSSWSHAFLCDSTWRLRPDTTSDRRLFRALEEGDYDQWHGTSLDAFEAAGQQEMLNWCPLLGAMRELGARLDWSEFVETHVFNSNKVFAVYHTA